MLRLDGIDAGYGGSSVLRSVSLDVPAGTVACLLGANGAGKTTLLRVAAGQLRPRSGSVSLDGVELTGRPAHAFARTGICLVPEGRSVFRALTVRDNLRLFTDRNAGEDDIAAALDALPRLKRHLDRPAGALSGGEQQMLGLARAVARRPRVVLLDEVSMGLAPRVIDELFAAFASLAADGAALLIVEQYVSRALELSEYVYVLTRGQVTFAGDAGEVAGEDLFARYVGL